MATDNFNRGDSGLGANWTSINAQNMSIVSQEVVGATSGGDHGAFYSADSFGAAQYSEARIAGATSAEYVGVCVYASASNCYGLYGNDAQCFLFKFISGVYTQLGSAGPAFSINDTVYIEITGGNITTKLNGSTSGMPSATGQTDLSSGKPGLFAFNGNSAARLDDWTGADLAGGTVVRTVATLGKFGKATSGTNNCCVLGTQLVANSSTGQAATYQTTTYNVVANKFYLAGIMSSATAANRVNPGLSGNAMLWTNITSIPIGSQHRLHVYRARSATCANGTLSIGFSSTQQGCCWNVSGFNNAWLNHGAGDNGSSAIIQYASFTGTAITSGTVTLSAFGTAGTYNGIYALFGHAVNQAHTIENGYTALGSSIGHDSPTTNNLPQWKSIGGDITPSSSWTTSSHGGGIALEINAAKRVNSRGNAINRITGFAVARFRRLIRYVTFGKSTLATVVRTIIGAGGTIYTKTISTIRTTSLSVSRLRRLLRNVSAIRPVSLRVQRLLRLIRNISFGKAIVSSVTRLRRLLKTITTRVSSSSLVSRLRRLVRGASESMQVSSRVTRIASYIRRISLFTGVASRVIRLRTVIRTVTDSLRISLILNKATAFARSIRTSIVSVVRVSRLIRYIRTIALSLPLKSALTRIGRYVRSNPAAIKTGAIVSRIGRYLRTIANGASIRAIVGQVKIGLSTLVRSVSTALTSSYRVSRIGWYSRRISVARSISSIVSRLAWLKRTVQVVATATVAVNRARRLIRTILTSAPISTLVSRLRRLLRSSVTAIRPSSIVKRIAYYIRTIGLSVKTIISVIQSSTNPIKIRTAATIVSIASRVSRIGRYIRKISAIFAYNSVVYRFAERLRTARTAVVLTENVSRLRSYFRSAIIIVSRVSLLGRISSYLRNAVTSVQMRPVVYRIVNYIRAIVTRILVSFGLKWTPPAGEAVILLLATTAKSLVEFTTSAMSKLGFMSNANQKDLFNSNAKDKQSFESQAKNKDNFG